MRRLVVIIGAVTCSAALADTVVPRDSVVNWVNVREEAVPGPNVLIVEHLHPGESAQFVSEIGSYYEVEMESGEVGFVSKAWTERLTGPNIKIASFNIQIFGKTKASKPDVMAELASIVRKYDVVAVQEIKDKAGNVPVKFLTEINSDGSLYTLVLSERSGLQDDDQTSLEQYAYYLNTETVHILEDVGLFDDETPDHFQREPYVAHFGANNGNFTFALVTVHTKPDLAVEETKALHDAIEWAKVQIPGEDDFIALGDFNASCNFADPSDFTGSAINDEYIWIIPDDADTNFSTSTACAYDRIVMTPETSEDYADDFGVDTSVSSNVVSDHFPVWAEFHPNNDN